MDSVQLYVDSTDASRHFWGACGGWVSSERVVLAGQPAGVGGRAGEPDHGSLLGNPKCTSGRSCANSKPGAQPTFSGEYARPGPWRTSSGRWCFGLTTLPGGAEHVWATVAAADYAADPGPLLELLERFGNAGECWPSPPARLQEPWSAGVAVAAAGAASLGERECGQAWRTLGGQERMEGQLGGGSGPTSGARGASEFRSDRALRARIWAIVAPARLPRKHGGGGGGDRTRLWAAPRGPPGRHHPRMMRGAERGKE